MTRVSTLGPEPPSWPLTGVSSDASAQPRTSGGGVGWGCAAYFIWLLREVSGADSQDRRLGRCGEPATPCPRLVFGRCALHTGPRLGALRALGRARREARARGQVLSGMPQRVRLRGVTARRAGLRPPRPRAALTQVPGARAVGPRAKRARGGRSLGPGHAPLARGRGGGGEASEYLRHLGSCLPCGPLSYLRHTVGGRASLLHRDARVPLRC